MYFLFSRHCFAAPAPRWRRSSESVHKVSRGDTLWRIANLYGTSVAQLKRANRHAGDHLQVGQVLRITKG